MDEHLKETFDHNVYTTRDFYFCAFALTLEEPRVVLLDLQPIQSRHRQRYDFVLGVENAEDSAECLQRIYNEFTSRKLRIEPNTFASSLSTLRARIIGKTEEMKNKRKRLRNEH